MGKKLYVGNLSYETTDASLGAVVCSVWRSSQCSGHPRPRYGSQQGFWIRGNVGRQCRSGSDSRRSTKRNTMAAG